MRQQVSMVFSLHLVQVFLCIGFKKMFNFFLNTEPTGLKLFSVCFIGVMVCVPLPMFFAPIGGFKNRFLFLGPTLAQKFWSPLIYNPFNDGFWTKISIFFFR